MLEHPIQGLMSTAMENIKEMVDVNTIVGDPVNSPDGSVIIPISKVSFGFAAGGGEYGTSEEAGQKKPFAGGSGAGISINPVAFMVVGQNQVKLLPINAPGDRVIEMVSSIADKLVNWAQCKTSQMNQTPGQMVSKAAEATKNLFNSGFSDASDPNKGNPQPAHHNDNPVQMAPDEELD